MNDANGRTKQGDSSGTNIGSARHSLETRREGAYDDGEVEHRTENDPVLLPVRFALVNGAAR